MGAISREVIPLFFYTSPTSLVGLVSYYIGENEIEFWYARELQKILEYKQWRRFESVIEKAKVACENSNISRIEHFVDVGKLSKRANNAEVEIRDYKLTRYVCYLIAQNIFYI